MSKLHHSGTAQETALRQAAVIRDMIRDLERTVQILNISICTEEERVRVFDSSDPAYPILARPLIARRDNLNVTIAFLAQRLHAIAVAIPMAVLEPARSTEFSLVSKESVERKAAC